MAEILSIYSHHLELECILRSFSMNLSAKFFELACAQAERRTRQYLDQAENADLGLSFCVVHHMYHIKNCIQQKDLLVRIIVLMIIALSALREIIALKDGFYNRGMCICFYRHFIHW